MQIGLGITVPKMGILGGDAGVGLGVGFFPGNLFLTGAAGAWYDPSDFSTLYQNSTGTTPVTAVEQPVGLMLDRSRGLVLGSELVTNGNFSDGTTAWIVLGAGTQLNSAFVVSGALQVSTTTEQNCATAVAVAAGKSIQIRFRARRVGATAVQCLVRASGNFGASSVDVHSFGNIGTDWADYVCVFTNLAAATTRLTFREGSGGGGLYEIDDVSAKDLPGNHATQATSASRPVLRSRYNLLTYSEQFDNAGWSKPAGAITANASTAPNGTLTADRYTPNVSAALNDNIFQTGITVNNGATYTYSGYIKYVAGADSPWIELTTVNPTYRTFINIQTRALGTVGHPTAAVTLLSDGWLRFSVSTTVNSTSIQVYVSVRPGDNNSGNINSTGAPAYDIWGASLLSAADQTATGGAYQRIAAATDYDTTNPVWRPYLAFDGTDDSFSTSSIDFSGTDEMTVFAGVTKLSDAARGNVFELGNAINARIQLEAPTGAAGNNFNIVSGGTTVQSATAAGFTSPVTAVITGQTDIPAPLFLIRVNGALVTSGSLTLGTGNFANAAFFIGSRNNASLFLNGRLYSLAVLGRTATAAELSAMEAWVNGKTGGY